MTTLKWSDVYYKQVRWSQVSPLKQAANVIESDGLYDGVYIGDTKIDVNESLDIEGREQVYINNLFGNLVRLQSLTYSSCLPQLAFYIFALTQRPRYMESYFPLVKSLDKVQRRQFHETIQKVMLHEGFDLQLLGTPDDPPIATQAARLLRLQKIVQRERGQLFDHMLRFPALGYLVAGHIVEVFFYRQDILDRLLRTGVHIWLYTDQAVFNVDGGVAGGCYDTQQGCIKLVVSRLFEGFNQPMPGVIPFLHEFGHLLDFFDAAHLKQSTKSFGWMPGMRQSDDRFPPEGTDIFTPEARSAFVKGKRIEMGRYDKLVAGEKPDVLPIGHPYVFQNNGEFLAGYLEMFFRNPHAFATQNPDLYAAFSVLLKQDPRQYWEQDFPFYVEQNRAYYHSGQQPPPHHLTLENDS
ncbi:MAG: hypothetical protein LCI00_14040 [Chloroflexi bacterium]|nr:hypothetical protein [Chloroflexota bacterium]MCC6892214.1 hypothetical protein [Anaerolineae bacterium]